MHQQANKISQGIKLTRDEENRGSKHKRPRRYASQQSSSVQQSSRQELRSDIHVALSNC